MLKSIAFVLTQSMDSPGGLGRYGPLAKELSQRGYEVHIIALHYDFHSLNKLEWLEDGVHIHYVGQMHVKKIGSEKLYFKPTKLVWIALLATIKLTIALFKINPEAVHLAKPHPMNGIATWLFTTVKNVPLYADCDDYEAAINHFGGNWQRKIVAWFEKYLPLQAKAITVNTEFTRKRLIRLGYKTENIIYVPNGVDRERFTKINTVSVNALKNTFGLHGKKVILYVGSLSLVSHNIDLLLKAFAQITPHIKDTVLMLVGGGEDRQLLLQLSDQLDLHDKVIHVGKVTPAEVPNYYKLAYLTVDPVVNSEVHQARCPLKIFESLAMGVPVVTSDVGDRHFLLQNGDFGFLADPNDVNGLAKVLIMAIQNESQINEMSQKILNERENIKVYWDLLIDDFIKVYDNH